MTRPISMVSRNYCAISFVVLCGFMLAISCFAPRFMAYAPALMSVVGLVMSKKLLVRKIEFPKQASFFILPVIAVAALSILWSVAPSFAIERAGKMTFILLSGLLLYALIRSLNVSLIRPFLWLLPVFTSLAIIFNIFELMFDMPIHRVFYKLGPEDELPQAVTNRSVICAICFSFLAGFILWTHEKFEHHRKYLIGAFVGLIALMLALSLGQSAQLAFVIGLVVFCVYLQNFKYAWVVLGGSIAILLLSSPWVAQFVFQNFASVVTDYEWFRNSYAAERMEIWNFIARYSLENPLLGYGIEATRHITDFESDRLYHGSNIILHPHNFALQLWIEFGVLGAIAACAFFLGLFWQVQHLPALFARITMATIFVFVSISSTAYGLWQSWWLGEIMFIFAMSALVHICCYGNGNHLTE